MRWPLRHTLWRGRHNRRVGRGQRAARNLSLLCGMPIALASASHAEWSFHEVVPMTWEASLRRCGGGFFHSPAGLRAGAPVGVPLFAELRDGDHVVGVAAGVRTNCRLSFRRRHAYFPTVPAFDKSVQHPEAMRRLTRALERKGLADVRWDAFDASWDPTPRGDAPARLEYTLSLDEDDATREGRCNKNHRRHIHRGDARGWTLTVVDPDAAMPLLTELVGLAATRATERGDGFDAIIPTLATERFIPGSPWGSTTFAARDGDTLLAAALVGWCNRRAYYISGGATAAGYELSASTWLHWRIAGRLALDGLAVYNLGGAPAAAELPDHPAHGLHRFKEGFGATIRASSGFDRYFDTGHLRRHELMRWGAGLAAAV